VAEATGGDLAAAALRSVRRCASTGGAHSSTSNSAGPPPTEPAHGSSASPETPSESKRPGLWSRFVQWSHRTFGASLFPQKAEICNCGADFGSPIPRPELVAREDIKQGTREWRMQLYGAALYWHMASTSPERMTGGSPDMLRGADVLEVACMRGGGARYLTELVEPRRYVATDHLQEHIDLCRKLHTGLPALEFERAEAEDLAETFKEGAAFDFVICVQAVATFADVPAFIRGVKHVLRPGGHLLLCDGLTRGKLEDIMNALDAEDFDTLGRTDLSRAVHAVGLCKIPYGLSYLRIVAQKPEEDLADPATS